MNINVDNVARLNHQPNSLMRILNIRVVENRTVKAQMRKKEYSETPTARLYSG